MTKITKIAKRVSIYLLAGLLVVYISLVTYLCSSREIAYLINDSVKSCMPIVPRSVAAYFLFNFRADNKDITDLKMNNGGLNYIVSALSNSKLSKEKKAKYIKYFISKGCGVNDFSGIDGLTPLHGAALSGDADTTELLLANGADPLLKSKGPEVFNNMTPLEVVERANKKFPKNEYVKIIEILREAESKNRQK